SNHPRQLRFVIGSRDGTHIHEDRTSREREGVDITLLDNVELVRPRLFPRDYCSQFPAKLLDVLRGRVGIWQDWHLLVDFGRRLQSQLFLFVLAHSGMSGTRQLRGSGGLRG